MKCAVLIYGMYREFNNSITKWDNIEKYYECDYYFSTWNKSKQKYSNSDLIKEFDVTPNMITDYLPNCVYDILDSDLIFPIKPSNPSSNMMLFHWKNVYKLMMDTDKKYDMVILIRSDGILTINNSLFNNSFNIDVNEWVNNSPNNLFGKSMKLVGPKPYQLISDDSIFAGNMDMIGKLINQIPDVTNIDNTIHIHFWLANTFKYLKWYPNSIFPFNAYFIRPEL